MRRVQSRSAYLSPLSLLDATVDVYVPMPLDLRLALAKLTPIEEHCAETARWLSGKKCGIEGKSFESK